MALGQSGLRLLGVASSGAETSMTGAVRGTCLSTIPALSAASGSGSARFPFRLIGAASAEIDDHVRNGSSSGRRHAALVALSF